MKNEADIVEQTLRAASAWCDAIYVLDNGSTDGSWEVVQELAHVLPCVVPFRQDPRPFVDEIRDSVFRAYRSRARGGDWWCILDADEFYIDDPRAFLAEVPRRFDRVWPQLYNYLFTDVDLANYRRDPSLFDHRVPIAERSRYYVLPDYAQLRFFRHSRLLAHIPMDGSGTTSPRRIRLKHYMYRSPEQIQRRLDTRREPMTRGEFAHELRDAWSSGATGTHVDPLPGSWLERVVPVSECHLDTGAGPYPQKAWTAPPAASRQDKLRAVGHSVAQRLSEIRRARRPVATAESVRRGP